MNKPEYTSRKLYKVSLAIKGIPDNTMSDLVAYGLDPNATEVITDREGYAFVVAESEEEVVDILSQFREDCASIGVNYDIAEIERYGYVIARRSYQGEN